MSEKQRGKASILFPEPPLVLAAASVVGKKEGEGPLREYFDRIEMDPMLGKKTWEEAESELQTRTTNLVIEKSGLKKEEIRYYFGGDLLAQLIATSFGIMDLEFPMFGIYGACSTMGEAMGLGSMVVEGGFADHVIVTASSHFASAEKQFRFPLEYGNQRPYSATWTVCGCGSVILSKNKGQKRIGGKKPLAKVAGMTTGKIVDMQFKDSMNMGAAMAMAALDTILVNFRDLGVDENYYDKIITGDLGQVGKRLLLDYLVKAGHDIESRYMDCGIEIFDEATQDTHAGGSGCGCSASVLCAYILPKIRDGVWKRVLFLPTGALLSTVSFNEGKSVPGIAHAVILEKPDLQS
ncbi:MAG: stage V sporulation protein AD [Lachnospiraceae bacterium]|nr:stage V sporulation protein AD [Lachnospiraceae bacterium]